MLLLSGGLLIALIVAMFFISQLYGSFAGSVENKQYMDLETKLEDAAINYVKDKNIAISGDYTIRHETLNNNGYIGELKDSNGNNCNGYVKVNTIDNINHYKAYISCNNYETINY